MRRWGSVTLSVPLRPRLTRIRKRQRKIKYRGGPPRNFRRRSWNSIRSSRPRRKLSSISRRRGGEVKTVSPPTLRWSIYHDIYRTISLSNVEMFDRTSSTSKWIHFRFTFVRFFFFYTIIVIPYYLSDTINIELRIVFVSSFRIIG